MKQFFAVLTKLISVVVIFEIILGLMTRLSMGKILIISAAVTILSYLIGDLIILHMIDNAVATVSDIAVSLLTILSFNYLQGFGTVSFTAAFVCALVFSISEWFFHRYLQRSVLQKHKM